MPRASGALTLAHGYVYIAYGGLLGDCGAYHGWVVGAPVAGGDLISYQVGCGRACGLWAPGGPSVDAAGNLWVASGNSYSQLAFDYGNAVIKLSPELKELGYFAPTDWAALSRADADLGSIAPLPLDPSYVWSSGKAGTGYLVPRQGPTPTPGIGVEQVHEPGSQTQPAEQTHSLVHHSLLRLVAGTMFQPKNRCACYIPRADTFPDLGCAALRFPKL